MRYGVVFDHGSVDTLSALTLTYASRCIALANIAIDLTKGKLSFLRGTGNEDKPFVAWALGLRLPGNPGT
jgi:hypothetical protein